MNYRTLPAALAALLLAAAPEAVSAPPLINYQGRVVVGTTNFHSPPNGQFKFALVNAAGTTTFWSNSPDIAPPDGQPDTAVVLTVTNGLYSVLLGDTTIGAAMAAIPASVFTADDVRLRVWFNDGTNGFQLLAPDQRLAPTPYLADGSVTAAKIAAGAVGSAEHSAQHCRLSLGIPGYFQSPGDHSG